MSWRYFKRYDGWVYRATIRVAQAKYSDGWEESIYNLDEMVMLCDDYFFKELSEDEAFLELL